MSYVGRFAPSPTGPLHEGSLVAALGSYLDARAHGGRWLLRIEDLDPPREVDGATAQIVQTLATLGFRHDGEIVLQHERSARYERALAALTSAGRTYPCGCTRRDVELALMARGVPRERHHEAVYPGTCRKGLAAGRSERSRRLKLPAGPDAPIIDWTDRNGQSHREDLASTVGDFILRRADGWWTYQLAVVVDDGEQGVTDIVRGADLVSSTARQIYLQRLLGYPSTRYLHLPLVLDPHGEKLSKQTGAAAIDLNDPIAALNRAFVHLGHAALKVDHIDQFWITATEQWAARWCTRSR